MALYDLAVREWEETDSFVRAVMQYVEHPDDGTYMQHVLSVLADQMQELAPERTGELRSSIRVEVESPTRGRVLMIYYGVWVDRGHRVIQHTAGRYRVRFDVTGKPAMKSSFYLKRTRPANFIRKALESPQFVAATHNVALAYRRRQSN